MNDKFTKEQQIERGQRAKDLAANPLLNEALEMVRERYLKEWMETAPEETSVRERLWLGLEAAKRFEAVLRTTISDGTVASAHMERAKGKVR